MTDEIVAAYLDGATFAEIRERWTREIMTKLFLSDWYKRMFE